MGLSAMDAGHLWPLDFLSRRRVDDRVEGFEARASIAPAAAIQLLAGRVRHAHRFQMSARATTDTPVPIVSAVGVTDKVPQTDEIEYPEGHWIAQSVAHGDAVEQATGALRQHFRERSEVLVAMELRVYYRRGNNQVWLQPDVQVVHGVGRQPEPQQLPGVEGRQAAGLCAGGGVAVDGGRGCAAQDGRIRQPGRARVLGGSIRPGS